MRKRATHLFVLGGAAALLGLLTWPERRPLAAVAIPPDENLCAQEAVPTRVEGTALSTLTSAGLEGMTYDTVTGTLQLTQATGAGGFVAENMSLDDVFIACGGDFDEDGWADFVGADYSGPDHTGVGFLKFYKNLTASTSVPDWSNPTESRDPSFSSGTTIEASSTKKSAGAMVCGDINSDGHLDFMILRCNTGKSCTNPTRADAFLGNGNGTFQAPYQFLNTLSVGGITVDDGARMVLYDVNKDGFKDLVVGVRGVTSGEINVYLNNQATPPKFVTKQTLVTGIPFGFLSAGVSTIAIADFTNDGKPDLIYGAIDSPDLTLVVGTDTGFDGGTQAIPFAVGYAVNIAAGDFARAGRADLVVVNDGLTVLMYANDGDSQPFSSGPTITESPGGSPTDTFDATVILNYDNDPLNTPDVLVANGDQESQAFVYANRPGATYVACGRATSGLIDTPELTSVDGTVTAIRLSPEPATPTDGTWSFEASNDNAVTWHPAPPCADDPTDYCADVSSTTGNTVRWRVTMCANAAQSAAPTMSAVETKYTYVLATTHFRAGPVMRDDVIYVGAVREPGHEGKFLAIDNSSGTVLWDAAAKLDAMNKSERHIFSQKSNLSLAVLDLQSITSSLLDLISVLGVGDLLQGNSLIDWLTSKRFGTFDPRTLGGILNSTAAVLSRPGKPYFYPFLSPTDQGLVDQHIEDFKDRQNLVFVGSQTGMLHAFYTNPTDPSDPNNGKEAWAFVPRSVSLRLLGDKTDDKVTAYVDGSPTLATIKRGSAYRSVLVMGEGTGGDEVFALDVTETVDSSGNVTAPQLLWRYTDTNMGDTISKPAVIRTLIGGTETWLAIFASGPDPTGDKGDTLYAVDMADGSLKWKFDIGDSNTYISTDITAADAENDDPDGYISRLYFGDNKGRLWKLDPAVFSSAVAAPVDSTIDVGLTPRALFSTRVTTGALGEDRAISANIIAVQDNAKRMVLYFGTGGTAETAAGQTNSFYAVYADTGEIRSQIDITGSVYNGASYQDGQIVFAQSEIPETVGPCVISDSKIVAIDAQTFAVQFFQEFEGRIASPMYVTGGEIFAVTVTGTLVTSQYTGNNAPEPAAIPIPGDPPPVVVNEAGDLASGFTLLGWRQTY